MNTPEWVRVATVPLDGGRHEAIITIWSNRAAPGVEVFVSGPGRMSPREARMLAAALVAASREAEEA